MEDQANKRLLTTSPVKNAIELTKIDHLASMSDMDPELTRMQYLSASMIDALYNLRKAVDRKEKFKEALRKVEVI